MEGARAEARARAIARNVASVRARIAAAEARAGRAPGGVRLVAVTKTVSADDAAAVLEAGVEDLAENRVADLARKVEALAARGLRPRWHMIGHLQRNKVRRLLALPAFFQALDAEALADVIERELERAGRDRLPCFVEVNVSGEATKGGLAPAEIGPFLDRLAARGRIEARGLMTMAPLSCPGDLARPIFRQLRELRDSLRGRHPALVELSMGMSQDFEAAVEEGATVVRVGSALFAEETR